MIERGKIEAHRAHMIRRRGGAVVGRPVTLSVETRDVAVYIRCGTRGRWTCSQGQLPFPVPVLTLAE
jgi:hypothetical protein